jgi:wyosine [tRNA(Phe)-imidazoG37] synthetase (radical SAM superfamily)
MGTILFNHIIFGPIKSRRLGNSLGVNLLPKFGKWCSFDCIYCECGWNKDGKKDTTLPTKEEVFEAMSTRLHELSAEGTPVDTITFSGNGEPTMHPAFAQIIDFTLQLRDKLYPSAKVSVLTNASQLGKKEVRDALQKIDNPILKIDSPLEHLVEAINIPNAAYKLKDAIENIKLFNHNFILQTMFLKGVENGVEIDDFSKLYDMETVIKDGIGYSDWSYESLAKELGLSGRQAFMYKMKAKSFTREELRQLERILQVKF